MVNSSQKRSTSRLELVPAERRSEIAKEGAAARWGYKVLKKGNFLEYFGIDADCFILDNKDKTAVQSQSGMAALLGLTRRGNSLPNMIERIAPYAGETGARIAEKLANPIIFQWHGPARGYDVTDIIDICDAIIQAATSGLKFQSDVVNQANIIKSASAKQGIKQLAWAVAGYDPTKEEVINSFKKFVEEEACEYAKEFPRALFEGWCRLYNLRETKINRSFSYWEPKAQFKKLVLDHIYHPLAGSDGAIKELVLRQREQGKRLFQYLSEEFGKPALRFQLGKVVALQELSDTKEDYESNFLKVFKGPPG